MGAVAVRRRRLNVDLDDVDWLDTRAFQPIDATDSLERLRLSLRLRVYRYNQAGGAKRFVVRSVPSQHVVVLFRIE
jgi:hypothetical protein